MFGAEPRTQRHSRSTTTRPTARPPPSRRCRPRSTPPHPATRSSSARATTPRDPARPARTRSPSPRALTLKGAGADLVVDHRPKANPLVRGRIIEEDTSDIRNGVGDIVAIVGTPTQPLTVNISGVTVNGYDPQGREVAVEAGILFLDAKGSINRSRVTNVVTSEGDNAYTRVGGWRGPQPGIGIVQTSNALLAPVDGARKLEHRPHARRQVQQDRHPDRRLAERLRRRSSRPARSTGASSPPARSSAARECVQLRRHRQLRQRRPAHDRPAVRPGRPARHQRLLRHGRLAR